MKVSGICLVACTVVAVTAVGAHAAGSNDIVGPLPPAKPMGGLGDVPDPAEGFGNGELAPMMSYVDSWSAMEDTTVGSYYAWLYGHVDGTQGGYIESSGGVVGGSVASSGLGGSAGGSAGSDGGMGSGTDGSDGLLVNGFGYTPLSGRTGGSSTPQASSTPQQTSDDTDGSDWAFLREPITQEQYDDFPNDPPQQDPPNDPPAPSAVPEPMTMIAIPAGLAGVGYYLRRRRSR